MATNAAGSKLDRDVTLSHVVTFARGTSASERKILEYMLSRVPYTITYDVLRDPQGPFKYKEANARKIIERMRKKGLVTRLSWGLFGLTQKPMTDFFQEGARHALGIVHHGFESAGAGEVGLPRVNGLQLSVDLGKVGVVLFRRLAGSGGSL